MSHDVPFPRTTDGISAPTAVDLSESASSDPNVVRCVELLNRLWPPNKSASDAPAGISLVTAANEAASIAGAEWGRFLLQRQVGQGSYGLVVLATDRLMKREVVLKIPQPHVLADQQAMKRFLREAEAAAMLTHPNIVPVYEVGEERGIPYIVSAYCHGPSLATWLAEEHHAITPMQAAQLVESLAGALDYAHSRGVLHRDLKPANILLDERPTASSEALPLIPKLTDFGLAKIAGVAVTETCEGALVGTFPYMAPEQAAGRSQDVGVRTDIWALGAILYELLAGERAFPGEDPSVLTRIQAVEPRSLHSLGLGIPLDLVNICQLCLRKDPADRYSTAHELLLDLQRFQHGEPVVARPLHPLVRSVRWLRRRPATAASLLAIVLLAAIGTAGIAWQWHRANLNAAAASAAAQRATTNLAEAQQSLLDFAWLIQEYALYRRNEDPVPTELMARLDAAPQSSAESDDSSRVQLPIRAAQYFSRGAYLMTQANFQSAEEAFGTAAEVWHDVVRNFPERQPYRRALALSLYCRGFCREQYAGRKTSQANFNEARHVFTNDATNPDANAILQYAAVVQTIGKSFALRNRRGEALRAYEEALEAAEEAAQRAPGLEDAQYFVARYTADVAHTEVQLNNSSGAPLKKYAVADQVIRALIAKRPSEERYCILRTEVDLARAGRLQRLSRSNEAQPIYVQAIADAEKCLADFTDRPAWLRRLALAHTDFAACQVRSEHPDLAVKNWEASEHYWRALDLDQQLCDQDRVSWAVVSHQLAKRCQQQGQSADAKRYARQGLDLLIKAQATIRESRPARLTREGCERLLADQKSAQSRVPATAPAAR